MKLLDYQDAWINDDAPLKIAVHARKVGLTQAAAHSAVKRNKNQTYFATCQDSARLFIQCVYEHALEQNIRVSKPCYKEEIIRDKKLGIYVCVVNSRVIKSYAQLAIVKVVGDVIIDNAAYQPELRNAVAAYITTALVWRDQLSVISSHNGEDSEFNALLGGSLGDVSPWSVHQVTLKDATRQGLYRRICEVKKLQWSEKEELLWLDSIYAAYPNKIAAAEELDCIPKPGVLRRWRELVWGQ